MNETRIGEEGVFLDAIFLGKFDFLGRILISQPRNLAKGDLMKRYILNVINLILRAFNAKIVRTTDDVYDMSSAVQRIAEHGIPVRSVIDIGASDGKWSTRAMKTLPKAFFVAIEALQERQSALERLKEEHSNFDYVLSAAGDMDGKQVTMNVSSDLDGSTVNGVDGESRNIPIMTVDTIVSEKKLEGPFLLKFDTHGYEVPILNGAHDTLLKTNVIIMEVYNFNITNDTLRFNEMCSYMEKLGFRCYDIASPKLRIYDKAFWQMDLFFCKSDSPVFSYLDYK